MTAIRVAFLSFLMAVFTLSASAHRVGVPLSTIDWNANTQSWELVHKFSLHDVEETIYAQGKSADFLMSEAGDAWLRDFVEERFVISGMESPPEFIGIEYDLDVVWVYYEIKPTGSPVTIDSDLRFDHGSKLYNLLNVTRKSQTESFTFREGNRSIEIELGVDG